MALGRDAEAAELFTQVAAARRGGPARLRVVGWEAQAAISEARGNAAAAGRAVDHGLRVAADYAGTLGATDLRAGAAMMGADLAKTGLRLALTGGSARQVLLRAEQWRAATFQRRPVRPPDDAEFAARLARLRAVVAQISEDGLAGRNVRELQAERVRLEQHVKELARHASGGEYVGLAEHVDHLETDGARERIAAEGRSVAPGTEQTEDRLTPDDSGYG